MPETAPFGGNGTLSPVNHAGFVWYRKGIRQNIDVL